MWQQKLDQLTELSLHADLPVFAPFLVTELLRQLAQLLPKLAHLSQQLMQRGRHQLSRLKFRAHHELHLLRDRCLQGRAQE